MSEVDKEAERIRMREFGRRISSAFTRNDDTEQGYIKQATRLLTKAKKLGVISQAEDIEAITVWLASMRTGISAATFRVYKASLAFLYLEAGADPVLLQALRDLDGTGTYHPKKRMSKRKLKGPAQKQRHLEESDLRDLSEYFYRNAAKTGYPAKTGQDILLWLEAGSITGLRPCEWFHKDTDIVLLDGGRNALRVKNGKNTNGRANGTHRHLILDRLDENSMSVVERHLATAKAHAYSKEARDAFTKNCRKELWRATRALWPRRKVYPTLYSARHQFSADAKSSGHKGARLGAMMGHKTTETSDFHYGKARHGRKARDVGASVGASDGGMFLIQPLEDEVKTVVVVESGPPLLGKPTQKKNAIPDMG